MTKEGRDRREKRLIQILEPLSPSEVREIQRASDTLTKALENE